MARHNEDTIGNQFTHRQCYNRIEEQHRRNVKVEHEVLKYSHTELIGIH